MKSHLKKLGKHTEKQVVIDENGEVHELEPDIKTVSYIAGRDDFYLMYSYFIDVLMSSKDMKLKVYAYLLEKYNAGTEFQLGNPIKKIIADKLDTSVSAVSNTITQLKKDNLLYSPDRGLYMLNPRYAFKGSSKERNKQLKVIIELGCRDC